MSGDERGNPGSDAWAAEVALARQYGERTLHALQEIVRLTDVGRRLTERGRDWYVTDPENVPGLAAEGLVIKVGENVARVSAACQADHPSVPWQVIKDMRNRLTHYYEATDYDVVWSTIESDFPQINSLLRVMLGSPARTGALEPPHDPHAPS